MRTEKEMMELIINVARNDDRVRAVYMNGSRTNPNAPRDIFQDYDIVYVVNETKSFIEDKEWIKCFGDIFIMQYPDESPFYPSDKENSYGWLMIFSDGNRIDLTVKTIECAKTNVLSDSLCQILLDKDGILPEIPESSDKSHHIKRPTQEQFTATCNEFWWCLTNVAKGLWRKEVTYSLDMLNFVVRNQLERMLSWKIGHENDYCISVGKSGKYMNKWLSTEMWELYLKTYCNSDIDSIWNSVDIMCRLFIDVSYEVSKQNGFTLNEKEMENGFHFVKMVKILPDSIDELIL